MCTWRRPAGAAAGGTAEGDEAARLIADGSIVFWFQGGMEYGPRALGRRSILALPNSSRIKDLLNLRLKVRVWYQPFCPSILERDAAELLENVTGRPNRFMTVGYRAKPESRGRLQAVLGADGSCRPQFVADDDSAYSLLLKAVKRRIGVGCVLNTSMNLHGEPLLASLEQAWQLMLAHDFPYLFCPGLKRIYPRV